MTSHKGSGIAPHVWLSEPRLLFHANRTSISDTHPLRGLLRHGPFSSGLVPDPIRIATIVPNGENGRLQSLISELDSSHNSRERKDYLPPWPGFGNVFRVQLGIAGGNCDVELVPFPFEYDSRIERCVSPLPSWADRGRQNGIVAMIQPRLPVIPSAARNLKSMITRPDSQCHAYIVTNSGNQA